MPELQIFERKTRRAFFTFRFNITFLLLTTALVAVVVAWRVDRSRYLISRTWEYSELGNRQTLKIQSDGTFVQTEKNGMLTLSGTVHRVDKLYEFTITNVSCDLPALKKDCQLYVGSTCTLRAARDGHGSLLMKGDEVLDYSDIPLDPNVATLTLPSYMHSTQD